MELRPCVCRCAHIEAPHAHNQQANMRVAVADQCRRYPQDLLLQAASQEQILSFFNPLKALPKEVVDRSAEIALSVDDFKFARKYFVNDPDETFP